MPSPRLSIGVPVRGSRGGFVRGSVNSLPERFEPLTGVAIDRDREDIDDPEFRKGFNDVRVSQENEVDPFGDDVDEV